VDPTVIGRLVDVNADLERVQVRLQGRVVAQHARVWARGLTLTDPAHVATAKLLREQFGDGADHDLRVLIGPSSGTAHEEGAPASGACESLKHGHVGQ